MDFELTQEFQSSCLQGYIDISYAELVAKLGPPNCDGDGYKVDAEWMLKVDGLYCTIYNYKTGVNYLGPIEGTPVAQIRHWHVGGNTKTCVDAVKSLLNWGDYAEEDAGARLLMGHER